MPAAFLEARVDLSDSDLEVAMRYGDRDGLVTVGEVERSLGQIPADVHFLRIVGGNRAQFDWYGEQSGDKS